MPPATLTDLTDRLRRDVDRSLRRARNGLRYIGGRTPPRVDLSPKQTVWTRDKVSLWRYESDRVSYAPPVLIVFSIVSRSYVLDLHPQKSFVGSLREAGFDVFLVDWGVPDAADAGNTLETYVDEYLPEVVGAVLDTSSSKDVAVIAYCFGAVLALLLAAGHPELPIRNMVLMATPIDFAELGPFFSTIGDGRIDPEELLDETGNMPAEVVRNAFRMLRPTSDVAQYVNLWENLWNDEFVDVYQSMAQWARDQIPFPGATLKQCAHLFLRDRSLVTGRIPLGGREVDLREITHPVLNVVAEQDHIVPPSSTKGLLDLLGPGERRELLVPAGHIGLSTGRTGLRVTLPAICEWLRTHGTPKASA